MNISRRAKTTLRAVVCSAALIAPVLATTMTHEAATASTSTPFKVLTYNVKHPTSPTTDLGGGKGWADRRSHVVDYIRNSLAGIVGLQEVRTDEGGDMRSYLVSALSSVGGSGGYAYTAVTPPWVGYDVNVRANMIFYRTGKFQLIDNGLVCFTSSASNPQGPCLTDGLSVSWAQLENVDTGLVFFVANTHFSDASAAVRVDEAHQVHNAVVAHNQRVVGGSVVTDPVLLMGDFNSEYGDDGTIGILAEGSGAGADPISPHPYNLDAVPAISVTANSESTFNTGWQNNNDGQTDTHRWDYLFASQDISWKTHSVDTSRVTIAGHGPYSPSDHYPVMAKGCYPAPNCTL